MSGELNKEDSLEQVSNKIEETIGCDSLDLVEIIMALEARGLKPTVAELIKLLEGDNWRDDSATPVRR
jgi:hypothetical protein